jgi:hypothetical protein
MTSQMRKHIAAHIIELICWEKKWTPFPSWNKPLMPSRHGHSPIGTACEGASQIRLHLNPSGAPLLPSALGCPAPSAINPYAQSSTFNFVSHQTSSDPYPTVISLFNSLTLARGILADAYTFVILFNCCVQANQVSLAFAAPLGRFLREGHKANPLTNPIIVFFFILPLWFYIDYDILINWYLYCFWLVPVCTF